TRKSNLYGNQRKLSNLLLLLTGTVLSQIFIKLSPVAVSIIASKQGIGLFNLLSVPLWVETLAGIIFLDFIIYWQHRYFHYSKFFWKFHRVHHLDAFLDATTALRFHPLEIIFSLLIKTFFVLLLGISVNTVLLFEIILSSMAIFNHANIQLPWKLENYLRYFIVTPNYHVIHHHPDMDKHNSNYGFNLSVWDYIFRSYSENKNYDFKTFECGLKSEREDSLKGMLMSPFKR
uniref:sterol desaturase family protein n=1 Tax=Halobacteriovorax sp. TaxID=2020862 RepID=UPI003562BFD0